LSFEIVAQQQPRAMQPCLYRLAPKIVSQVLRLDSPRNWPSRMKART
jgi:hypothetical protein